MGSNLNLFGKSIIKFLMLTLVFISFPALSGEGLKRYVFSEKHMGTTFRIILYADNVKKAEEASDSAFEKIEQLNDKLSDYLPDSELNQLNNAAVNESFQVSKELFEVLKISQKYAKMTNGAFDITVGPFVQIWRKSRSSGKMPDTREISKKKKTIGYKKLRLNESLRAVTFKRKNMKIDLGAIGKGYAADQAMEVLNSYGIRIALIDAGGDVVLGESPPDTEGWKVQLGLFENAKADSLNAIIPLENCAIATSGDLYQYIEHKGKRYSHIINPKTGKGLVTQSRVTIIAPSGSAADALASAVSVMGNKKGFRLIQRLPDTEVIYFQTDKQDVQFWQSKNFIK